MTLFAQMSPQIPDLPAGPSLDHVRGPVTIPPYETWQYAVMILMALLIFALLSYLLYKFLARPKNHAPDAPIATYQKEIEALQLVDSNDPRSVTLLSQAVRRYIRSLYPQIPQGLTSSEFCQHIAVKVHIHAESREQLSALFRQLDQLKFAPQPKLEDRLPSLIQEANELVATIEANHLTNETESEDAPK